MFVSILTKTSRLSGGYLWKVWDVYNMYCLNVLQQAPSIFITKKHSASGRKN